MARRPAKIWTGTDWDDIGDASKVLKTGDTITGPTAVDVNSSSTALRVTQVGSGNALVVEDSANPDATPFVVDASGNLIVGHNGAIAGAGSNPKVMFIGVDAGTAAAGVFRYSADGLAPQVQLNKSRSATIASHEVVQSQDTLGNLIFSGSDGTAFIPAAQISAAVDGTPGTNDMPGRLVFRTTADGASTPTERMRITNAGQVGIGTTPTAQLHLSGTDGTIWNDAYSDTGAPRLLARRARGTSVAPTASQTNDQLLALDARGYGTTGFASGPRVRIFMAASQNYTDAAQGTYMAFLTTPDGSTSLTERMRIDNAGLITGTGTSLGAWTAYTPTLGGTGWAIGNGTATGAYCQIGKVVHFRAIVAFGSTSTFGASNTPTISLPLTAATSFRNVFNSMLYDASTALAYSAAPYSNSTTSVSIRSLGASGAHTTITATAPFTWATSDEILLTGTYDIA